MKNRIYLSEDSIGVMRSFTRTAERLIGVLEDVIEELKEVPEGREEIAKALERNAVFMKNLAVKAAEKEKCSDEEKEWLKETF